VTALSIAILILSMVVIVGTFLPMIPTHAGIVRICDFPRPQILVAGLIALGGLVLVQNWTHWTFWVPAILLMMAILVQASRIAPYTALAPTQTRAPDPDRRRTAITLLIANVRQENRQAGDLVKLIESHDPDICFLVEIDDWWAEQLEPIATRYSHVTLLPQDNGYGLLFMTRFPIKSCIIRRLVKPEIPSLKVFLTLPNGHPVQFYGLHPEPPGPIQDAEDRDAELLIVAREIGSEGRASIVAGDLNDVAWSRTNASFQRLSKALDPRRGRGFYSTFHADYRLARWPIDHLFHTSEFATETLDILPHFGSDHLPVFSRLTVLEESNHDTA
jgi:endonuclease/exonuclease/phosphatase (EEP) superfamily protein YafD